MEEVKRSLRIMTEGIVDILYGCDPTIYLYGSLVLEDFRPGWSDIDVLVLTEREISTEQAEKLVDLRQMMLEEEPGNPYYRSFEGGMMTLEAFVKHIPDTVVYWGTSGQRVTDRYEFDAFCMAELLESGVLLYGKDVREKLEMPSYSDLKANVRSHYEAIRRYAESTGRSIYSYGWLLDISRCLYTLTTGKIISKTVAAEWALEKHLCPVSEALKRALEVRKEPRRCQDDSEVFDYAETLGPAIQRYADVLEEALCMK